MKYKSIVREIQAEVAGKLVETYISGGVESLPLYIQAAIKQDLLRIEPEGITIVHPHGYHLEPDPDDFIVFDGKTWDIYDEDGLNYWYEKAE